MENSENNNSGLGPDLNKLQEDAENKGINEPSALTEYNFAVSLRKNITILATSKENARMLLNDTKFGEHLSHDNVSLLG